LCGLSASIQTESQNLADKQAFCKLSLVDQPGSSVPTFIHLIGTANFSARARA